MALDRASRPFVSRTSAWLTTLYYAIAFIPVYVRILRPTITSDDVIRLVNLIEHPLREVLFLPYAEHLAVFFDLISWTTWQLVSHDLRLVPLGYAIASVIPWMILLPLLSRWLHRECGSRTAAWIAVAIVAQSPFVLEDVWWYSASSFSWAIIGILLAVLGAGRVGQRPGRSLPLVVIGSALGPAGTTIGHLAMPLAILRAAMDRALTRWHRLMATVAAITGVGTYLVTCAIGGRHVPSVVRHTNGSIHDLPAGLAYALKVPAQILVPSSLGLPASWCATLSSDVLFSVLGSTLLGSLLVLVMWPNSRWNRQLVFLGIVLIYVGYSSAFAARAGLVKLGIWTEAQLICQFGARYHVVPLIGLAAILSAMLARPRAIRRIDARAASSALVGTLVSLALLAIQHREIAEHWSYNLEFPDQKATLAALQHVRQIAVEEGISRDQLLRIVAPAVRPWNDSVLRGLPSAFPMMKLVDAPAQVASPHPDDEARAILHARLSRRDRLALGSGSCALFDPAEPAPNAQALAVAQARELRGVEALGAYRYRSKGAGYIMFTIEPHSEARFLEVPGLRSDQDLNVFWKDASGRWRPALGLCLVRVPGVPMPSVVDLRKIIHWNLEPVSTIAIHFTHQGEIAMDAPPRLLR